MPHPRWGGRNVSNLDVIASQSSDWRGNPYPKMLRYQITGPFKECGLPRRAIALLAMTWKLDTSPISFACLRGVSKGGNGGKVGFQNAFSVPHFGRLGVRDHTGGPGGSLHTFSPERKYEHLSLITDSSTSHLRCSAQNDIGGCSIVPG